MASKIQIIRTGFEIHSELWYDNRLKTLGASDVSAVLGLSQYTPTSKLFCEKAGIIPQWKNPNRFTYWGTMLEELIANTWKYYSGEEDSYIANQREGKIMRECRKVNGYY